MRQITAHAKYFGFFFLHFNTMAATQTFAEAVAPIAVISDVEPDDVVALRVIIDSNEFDEVMILVTDSPDPSQKVDRMMELLPKRESTRVKVTVGAPSRKTHPWVSVPASGTKIPNSFEEFRRWLVANPDASLLAISPPRDLLALVKSDSKILAKRMVGYYGSFNSRTLAVEAERQRPGAGADKMAEIATALESAQHPYYFDTFNGFGPTGRSILTRTDVPGFFAAIPGDLRDFIASWNEDIAEVSIRGLAEWFDIAVTGGMGSGGYRLDIPAAVEKATGEGNEGKWRRTVGAQSRAFVLGKDSEDTIGDHLKEAGYDEGALRYIAKDRQKLTAMALNGLDGQMVFADPAIAAAMTLTGTGGKSNKCEVKRAMTADDWFNTIPCAEESARANSKITWISPHLAGKNVEAFRSELLGSIVKLLKRN